MRLGDDQYEWWDDRERDMFIQIHELKRDYRHSLTNITHETLFPYSAISSFNLSKHHSLFLPFALESTEREAHIVSKIPRSQTTVSFDPPSHANMILPAELSIGLNNMLLEHISRLTQIDAQLVSR